MRRLAVVLCVALCALGLASVASAGIMVTAPTFSVPNTNATGSFTVTVTFTGSYDVTSYDIGVILTGATGLTFTGASEATDNYVFSLPHGGFYTTSSDATEIWGWDGRLGKDAIENHAGVTKNLITVNYHIDPGTEGVFDVTVDRTDGFAGNSGPFAGQDSTPGVITITPEPATMALLAAGALAMIRRRR